MEWNGMEWNGMEYGTGETLKKDDKKHAVVPCHVDTVSRLLIHVPDVTPKHVNSEQLQTYDATG